MRPFGRSEAPSRAVVARIAPSVAYERSRKGAAFVDGGLNAWQAAELRVKSGVGRR